jgi:hypothetical protein
MSPRFSLAEAFGEKLQTADPASSSRDHFADGNTDLCNGLLQHGKAAPNQGASVTANDDGSRGLH